MGNHAILSASSSKKWLNCPGSVTLEKEFPNEESEFAKEGTMAHALGELKIKLALKEMTRVQYHKQKAVLQTDIEMEKYMDEYKDFVLERYHQALAVSKSATIFLEQKVDYSDYAPEGFGTSDVIIVTNGKMEIIDLKYGKGVTVSAQKNTQMMLYALGALKEYDFIYDIKDVIMTIYQPRKDNIESFEMTAEALYQWGAEIGPLAEKAYQGTKECIAGSHCTEGFCRAKAVCRTFAESMEEIESYANQAPEKLNNNEIAEVLDKVDQLIKWAKSVKEYALQKALQGETFIGFKVVEGRKRRRWNKSDEEMIKILQDMGLSKEYIYKKTLRSVADMEKEVFFENGCFIDILGEHIDICAGAPTLVPIEDKRKEWNPVQSAAEDFSEIETF